MTREMLSNGILSPEQLRAARRVAADTQRGALEVLEEQCKLEPSRFVDVLASTLHYTPLPAEALHGLQPAFDVLPFSEAIERECLPLRDPVGGLLLVIADPLDAEKQAWAEQRVPLQFEWRLAARADVAAYFSRHEQSLRAMDGALPATARSKTSTRAESLSFRSISEDTSPVVKLVNSTLYDAVNTGVSDIHLETVQEGLVIRYRLDGVLSPIGSIPQLELAEQVVSRIKIMSELDISERRVPQDGRFKVAIQGREVDVRVSVMPSVFGEDAVLRILDKQALSDQFKGLRLDYLGFDGDALEQLRRLAAEPYGMLLVTGPTGSGKTTTLYAAISEINTGRDKIVTIEDPVEYQLAGVLQIPVNEKKGLTFARGLRSILRHDPDKIMVGEIRDPETAQIAVQSALTGHLVFTTVHANNVFDVIGRFIHMGVDPYSFVSALNGIVAQRLVRMNCPQCVGPVEPEPKLLHASGISPAQAADMHFQAGRGCGHCRGTGFRGRRAIGEVLYLNDDIREAIVDRKPVRVIREAAARSGARFLRDKALDLVAKGETTVQEINRVTLVA